MNNLFTVSSPDVPPPQPFDPMDDLLFACLDAGGPWLVSYDPFFGWYTGDDRLFIYGANN